MLTEIINLLIDRKAFFLQLLLQHVMIAGIAIILSAAAGILIGILMSEVHFFNHVLMPVVNFIYTIPSIAMLGFLIPFLGIGNTTAVVALTIYGLLPVVRNTYTGLTTVDPQIVEAARAMGSTRWQLLYKIKLPLGVPVIMAGVRNVAVMTIALGGIASFIGAGGLGIAIYRGITTNNPAMTMAGSLLIAILALAADYVFGLASRLFDRSGVAAKNGPGGRNRGRMMKGALLAAACGAVVFSVWGAFVSGGEKTLHIATKPMTEQYILGEMNRLLIEQELGVKAEVTQGVGGGTSNIWPAIQKREFDMYPEYTGTAWNMILKEKGIYTEDQYGEMAGKFEDMYKVQWKSKYGFSNSYALAVRGEVARRYGLKKISDLSAVSDRLLFGAEYDFYEREDGYDPLCALYDLHFAGTVDLDIGLKYDAIDQGKIDVMPVFTTDGRLSVSDLVVLEDDRQFYPSYACANIITDEALEKFDGLEEVLDMMDGLISDAEMAKMNYEVENDHKKAADVARSFLIQKGVLKK